MQKLVLHWKLYVFGKICKHFHVKVAFSLVFRKKAQHLIGFDEAAMLILRKHRFPTFFSTVAFGDCYR